MSEDAGRVPDAATAFAVLTRVLLHGGRLSPRAAVVLDFTGKAMGLDEAERRRLVQDPAAWAPPPLGVLPLVEPFLADCPDEVRQDTRESVLSLLCVGGAAGAPAPVCPVCKNRDDPGAKQVWSPPHASGLGPLEGIRHSIWSCLACQAVIECVDQFDGSHRSRQMCIVVKGPETEAFLERLVGASRDPDQVVEVLGSGPTHPWLMERVWGAPLEIWSALGATRNRLLEAPEAAPEAYRQRHALVRLGPPPSPSTWASLVDDGLEPSLLARLASLPSAPTEVRRQLLGHPDPEVRYQAFQAPDVPYALLDEALGQGQGAALLSMLDREDVGARTLERALESQDPSVLYRATRHPALNLILLEKAREVRRGSRREPLPSTRVLHVYAPQDSRDASGLLARLAEALEQALDERGWQVQAPASPEALPEVEADGTVRVTLARVTQSRVLLFLPMPPEGQAEDLAVAHLAEAATRAFLADAAQEVIDLRVHEGAGQWEARLRRGDEPAQRIEASGLPTCHEGEEPGRWLEFELFCAERALPFAGIPASEPTPRLLTRPPYQGEPVEERRTLRLLPPGAGVLSGA